MIGPDLIRSMHPAIISLGLADQQELDELDHSVRAHLNDPATLVIPHLSFLAWGRKPDTQHLLRSDESAPRSADRGA